MQIKALLCSVVALASSSAASDEALNLIQTRAGRQVRDSCDDAKAASAEAKQTFNDLKKQMKDLKASLKAARADMKSTSGSLKGACPKKPKSTPNVYESAPGVGGWGGMCTCPDGQQYNVGDMNDACGSLACVGGTPGPCERVGRAERTGMKATCGSGKPPKKSKKAKVIEGPISAVIVSEYDTYDGRFPAKNVLDSTWQGGSHNNGQTYLTRNCGGGWFVMQMQDVGAIKEFHILNTCNTPYNDRSAKDITISLSSDNSNWDTVLNYQMQRCTPIKGDPLVLPNPEPIKAQYIKVELKTCYGASAGLNYFQAFR